MSMEKKQAPKSERPHSPLPWHKSDANLMDREIAATDDQTVCVVFREDGIRELDEALANGDLILRAVNSFDALVDVLKKARGLVSELTRAKFLPQSVRDNANEQCRAIDAALASAKE